MTTIKNVCETCEFKKCICEPSWASFDTLLKESRYHCEDMEISPIIISTITVNFYIDYLINLEKLDTSGPDISEASFYKGSRKSKIKEVNNNFYNQKNLSLNLGTYKVFIKNKQEYKFVYTERKLNIKASIFCNGRVKIVGCRHVSHVIRSIHILHDLFNKNRDCFVSDKKMSDTLFERKVKFDPIPMKDVRISMINGTFYIQKRIIRKQLYLFLKNTKFPEVSDIILETEKHEAVRIKYNRSSTDKKITTRKKTIKKEGELTIMVFNTGSVILTGGSSIVDLVSAYKFIISLIKDYDFLTEQSS